MELRFADVSVAEVVAQALSTVEHWPLKSRSGSRLGMTRGDHGRAPASSSRCSSLVANAVKFTPDGGRGHGLFIQTRETVDDRGRRHRHRHRTKDHAGSFRGSSSRLWHGKAAGGHGGGPGI